MQPIQYNACLAITCAIRCMSKEKNLSRIRPRTIDTKNFVSFIKFSKMNIQNTFIISFLEEVHHVLKELCVILTLLRKSKLKIFFFLSAIIDPVLDTLRVVQSLRRKHLISYDLSSNSFFDCFKLNPIQDGRGGQKGPLPVFPL